MKMIRKIWNWFSLLGVNELQKEENSLTILYNRMALFSVITLTFFSIYLYFVSTKPIFFYITVGVSLVYALILVLNGLDEIYWARLCTSLGTVVWVSIYHVCFGGFFSQSLAVGAAIIINYVAFRRKAKYMKLLFVLHAGVYLLALIYGIKFEPIIEFTDYPPSGLVSFIVSMSWVTLILIVFYQDERKLIQNLKAKNKELERTTSELERFTYIASHDLKSPLRTIISFGGMIKRDITKGKYENIVENMNFVMTGAKQMNYIIKGVLELSQLKEIDRAEKEKVDLNEVLKNTKANLNDEINQKNAEIQADLLPVVLGNKVEFLILFQNFIQNAIKYNKSKIPTIIISSQFSNNRLVISFTDNGIGIDKKYFEKIFEFFKRLHNSSEYEGTGIGLGLCKNIVDNYDGNINVDSQVGKGTTFAIYLPYKEHEIILPFEAKVATEVL